MKITSCERSMYYFRIPLVRSPQRERNGLSLRLLLFGFLFLGLFTLFGRESRADSRLRILIVTGGCCHDYPFQTKMLMDAAQKHELKVDWTVIQHGGTGTQGEIEFYRDPQWSRPFDLVIHNECFADTANPEYIRRITQAHHSGTPALVIHCAMHSYRAAAIDDWREFLGITSKRHDHQSRYPVKAVAVDHPIMQGFPQDYVTPMDELYIVEKVWPNTQVLATSPSERDGKEHPVVWTNQYGKGRVFGTTYGHSNETFTDPVFLETLIRGIRWATEVPAETKTGN